MNAPDPQNAGPVDAASESELVERSRALTARSEELDQFSRMAAHDLRAPLRSIEAFSRLAIESEDADEIKDFLDRVLNATVRMRRLLDSLLQFAESGRPDITPSVVPLEDLVHGAVSDLAADFDEAGAAIDIGPLPSLRCHPAQLQRVFANIFSNSIRYCTDNSPQIVVRAIELESEVIITITDNGDGFPAQAALEVFQPLRRLSNKGDGQGLGLAICKRIVESHGGSIRAQSEPTGGTTITVTFPKVGEAPR